MMIEDLSAVMLEDRNKRVVDGRDKPGHDRLI
jgi:hypothetical protein